MKLISKLLSRNMPWARVACFAVCNFVGLAIVAAGLQLYLDCRSLVSGDEGFMHTDWLTVSKRVTAAGTWDSGASAFTPAEIDSLRRQPWVRGVGEFTASDYRVWASVATGGRGMSTMLFFESLPDAYVDVKGGDFTFRPGDTEIPVVIPRDYLSLYNFGFAGGAGLPQVTEGMLTSVPVRFVLTSDDGHRQLDLQGRIVGFSSRINTILVPQGFMDWSNARLGAGTPPAPSRLMVDVSSPGDVAIGEYLERHGLETGGDNGGSRAAYLLRVAGGVVLGIGVLITVLSFFILLLSVSLLMERNRSKIHGLLLLGCSLRSVEQPYLRLVTLWTALPWALAAVAELVLRSLYLPALEGLGAAPSGWTAGAAASLALAALLWLANVLSVRRRVRNAWGA